MAQTTSEGTDRRPDDGCEAEQPLALTARGWFHAACFLVAAVATSLIIRLSIPTVPDPDSFYHLRHAALYAERGLTLSAFPWLAYSVISRFGADLGYGFHVLILPFAWLRDPVLGARLAAALEIALAMVVFYWTMRRHAMAFAFAWPYMLIFFAPAIVYTVIQTRPQTLTMVSSALLLSFLLSGSAWGVFGASAAISAIHLNAAAVVPVVVIVAAAVQAVVARQWEWRKWLAAALGVAAGWALRPNSLGAARLLYVQTVVHETVRQRQIPLLFGKEWSPVPSSALPGFFYVILIWAATAVVFLAVLARHRKSMAPRDRAFLWSSLLLSIACFIAAMVITKRTVPLWAAFSVMFIAKTFTLLLNPSDRRPGQLLGEDARLIGGFATALLLVMMVFTGANQVLLRGGWTGSDPARLKGAADWIRAHARPGEIVYNVNWDEFPELFFWNTDQHYVSGLDPVFLYAYDEGLYWKAHHLQAGDATSRTWRAMAAQGAGEDTYTVIRKDFRASYLLLDKRRNIALDDFLRTDRRFTLGYEDARTTVFELTG